MVAEPIRQRSRMQRYSIFAPLPPNTRKAGVRTSLGFQKPCQSPCQLMPETLSQVNSSPARFGLYVGFSISSPRSEVTAFHLTALLLAQVPSRIVALLFLPRLPTSPILLSRYSDPFGGRFHTRVSVSGETALQIAFCNPRDIFKGLCARWLYQHCCISRLG